LRSFAFSPNQKTAIALFLVVAAVVWLVVGKVIVAHNFALCHNIVKIDIMFVNHIVFIYDVMLVLYYVLVADNMLGFAAVKFAAGNRAMHFMVGAAATTSVTVIHKNSPCPIWFNT